MAERARVKIMENIEKLDSLLKKIKKYTLIGADLIDLDKIDGWLDERDESEFENEYIRVTNELDELKKFSSISKEEEKKLASIAKIAFARSFQLSDSDEFASSVSDDLTLIGQALIFHYNDPWLTALFDSYRQNIFPRGRLI